jgi:putative oxidoreductase
MTEVIRTWSKSTATGYSLDVAADDIGLLLLRLILGVIMTAHGTQKLFGWFGGYGLSATGQFFTMSGYPAGHAMAVIAGLTEVLGGLGLVVGLLTPLAAAAVVGTMLNAVAMKWSGGFFAPKGYEYELLLTVAAAATTLTGPGRLALDHLAPALRDQRLRHGIVALAIGLVAGVVFILIKN